MKKFIAYFFVALFVFQGLMFVRQPEEKILPYENRNVREFPTKVRFTARGIKNFFSDLDGYFNDRIIGRERVLSWYGRIPLLSNEGDLNQAIIGLDDWLFLGATHDRTLDKLVGKPSPATVKKTEGHVAAIIKRVRQINGSQVAIFICPNKSSIYPEYLPEYIRPATDRYVEPALAALTEAGLMVVDPIKELLEAKKEGHLLYWRSDTHWNPLGASKSFEFFLKTINPLHGRDRFGLPGFSFTPEKPFNGDLVVLGNFLNYKAKPGDNYRLIWTDPPAGLITIDQQGRQYPTPYSGPAVGHMVLPPVPFKVINPSAAIDKTVWFYHDSFGVYLAPFFHAAFKETRHFTRGDFFKETPLEAEKPDLIIYEVVERRF